MIDHYLVIQKSDNAVAEHRKIVINSIVACVSSVLDLQRPR